MDQAVLIGIDIGGTKIYGGIVTPGGEILHLHKVPTPHRAGPQQILQTVFQLVASLLKSQKITSASILGIGAAVPGIVDARGRIVITPNINLSGIDLRKILEKKYKTRVSVGNDVNYGILGEKWLGAGRKARNIIGLFPGTGVGGGILINGELITGTHGAAAELGHILVDPAGPLCTCGNTGCLEALAGRWAIERDLKSSIKKGGRSVLTKLAGKDLKQIKSSTLAKALKARDPLVTRTITRAAHALARACVSLNHIFDPEIFLFGGGLIEACGDAFLPVIEKALQKDPFFRKFSAPLVVQAKLGDDAVMLGAVAAVRQAAGLKELADTYYPPIKLTSSGKLFLRGQNAPASFFIRADGKIKEAAKSLSFKLSDEDLEEFCKKGPDVFFIARPHSKRIVITPKGLHWLRKKKILPRILSQKEAVRAYSLSTERKAALFYL